MKLMIALLLATPFLLHGQTQDIELFFEKNESRTSYEPLLELKNESYAKIEVFAYTDSSGTEEYNDALSKERGENVIDYLTSLHISPSIIQLYHFGESDTSNLERKVVVRCHKPNKPKIRFSDFQENVTDTFLIDYQKDTILITSNNTIITINRYDIISFYSDSVMLTVTEYSNRNLMLMNDLTTTSNGKLLISGGMIEINGVIGEGDSVYVNNIQVEQIQPQKGMSLFYPEEPDDSTYNWILEPEEQLGGGSPISFGIGGKNNSNYRLAFNRAVKLFLSSKKKKEIDSLVAQKRYSDSTRKAYEAYQEEQKVNRVSRRNAVEDQVSKNVDVPFEDIQFYTFNTDRFGIINVDKFYKSGKPFSPMNVKSNVPLSEVRIIFKDIMSMLPPNGYSLNHRSAHFISIPSGEPFNIIALSEVDGSIYFSNTAVGSQNLQKDINVELKPIEQGQLLDELSKI